MRHVILYLLFPDDYERIASEGHKARIAEAFSELLDGDRPDDVDDRLKAIRDQLQQYLPAQYLDFYWAPLRECWYVESESDTISPLQALGIKRQIVMYGPPGTGKTYQAREIASSLIRQRLLQLWGPKNFFAEPGKVKALAEQRMQRVQFHPGYGYEDFVRGIQIGAGGQTEYRDGALLRLVAQLENEPEETRAIPFVLILDEMNRADLSKVLGECFTLLEDRDSSVRLGGHDEKAKVVRLPPNLHFIGTMNLIDQSLEQVDFALRRRFLWFLRGFSRDDFLAISHSRWEALVAAKRMKKSWASVEAEFEELADRAQRLNADIDTNNYLGPQYQIGHTYFCDIVAFAYQFLIGSERRRNRVLFNRSGGALDPVAALWRYSLQPLLEQCKFACNLGSDSISMKLLGGLALFSRRNQRHAHQISDFVPGPEGPRRGQRQACRRNDRRDRPGRSPYRRLPAVRSCVAARSQPLYPAGVGSALFRSKDSPSRCHAPVCLQRAPLPAQDLRRALR